LNDFFALGPSGPGGPFSPSDWRESAYCVEKVRVANVGEIFTEKQFQVPLRAIFLNLGHVGWKTRLFQQNVCHEAPNKIGGQ